VRVLWTDAAEAHLRAIHAYHSQTSARYADRLIDRITGRSKQLAEFPNSGSILPQAEALQIRMLMEDAYRILYVVGSGHVDILGVIHSSRGSL
jgi:toxin ParE1/3/4